MRMRMAKRIDFHSHILPGLDHGSADLETLNEMLGTELPLDDEYDTLGGLVFSRLNEIPADVSGVISEICGEFITRKSRKKP